jgi:hypothetical protein
MDNGRSPQKQGLILDARYLVQSAVQELNLPKAN